MLFYLREGLFWGSGGRGVGDRRVNTNNSHVVLWIVVVVVIYVLMEYGLEKWREMDLIREYSAMRGEVIVGGEKGREMRWSHR